MGTFRFDGIFYDEANYIKEKTRQFGLFPEGQWLLTKNVPDNSYKRQS